MERGRGGKGEREWWGRPPALLPPTGFGLKCHPDCRFCWPLSSFCLWYFYADIPVWRGRWKVATPLCTSRSGRMLWHKVITQSR